MIVLSGVLVLVALVLLIVGIFGPLGAVYGSIVASLVAAVLLAVAVYTRRGAPAPVPTGGQVEPEPATGTTWLRDLSGDAVDRDQPAPVQPRVGAAEPLPAVPVAVPPVEPVQTTPVVEREVDRDREPDRIIWVIDERPLYHRQGCVHLADGEPIPLDVEEAREDGFVPCPVCRPDDADADDADSDDADTDMVEEVEEPRVLTPEAPAAPSAAGTRGGSVPLGSAAAPAAEPVREVPPEPIADPVRVMAPAATADPVRVVPPAATADPDREVAPAKAADPVPVATAPGAGHASAVPSRDHVVEPRDVRDPAEREPVDVVPEAEPATESAEGEAVAEGEGEAAAAAERERVRVAMPAPPPADDQPTGLVGRLLRRRS